VAAVARTGGVRGRLKRAARAWKERRLEERAVMRGAAVREVSACWWRGTATAAAV